MTSNVERKRTSNIVDLRKGTHVPITAFNSFTDGLDAKQRSREHFVTNIDLEDDLAGFRMPMVSGFSPATSMSHPEDSALF